jgi:hypothetical protein
MYTYKFSDILIHKFQCRSVSAKKPNQFDGSNCKSNNKRGTEEERTLGLVCICSSGPWGWYAFAPPVLPAPLLRGRGCVVHGPPEIHLVDKHSCAHSGEIKMVGEMKSGPALRWWCWICSEVRKITALSTSSPPVAVSWLRRRRRAAGADVAGGRAGGSCWC